MARETGKTKGKRIRYFYIDGELHRVLQIRRPQDLVTAWNFPKGRRFMYVWSDVQRRMQKAFTVTEVANMLGRHRMTVDECIRENYIPKPGRTYRLETKAPGRFMLSEDDVLRLHEYFLDCPRMPNLPTREEVKAMLKTGRVLYALGADGEYVPVWKEQAW